MKGLSIEEKAKRYDEALHKAKRIINVCVDDNTECRSMIACIQEIFPELKESVDEKVKKAIFGMVYDSDDELWSSYDVSKSGVLAWLEKQDEHKKFRDSIQVGDKVTRNQDGMLVNLSQLKRIAKPNETKQGKQKPYASETMNEKKDFDSGFTRMMGNEQKSWSREDEMFLSYIIKDLVHPCNEYIPDRIEYEIVWLKNRLKSLKPQSQWKPSDAQIASITCAVRKMKESSCYDSELVSLLNDLKKLKE